MATINQDPPSLIDIIESGKDAMYGAASDREMVRELAAYVLDMFSEDGTVNLVQVFSDMDCDLCSYSEVEERSGKHVADIMRAESQYGFTGYDSERKSMCVYYNDEIERREVFTTLQHELGHLVMKHILMSETGEREEKQADFFSKCMNSADFFEELLLNPKHHSEPDVAWVFPISVQITFLEKDKMGNLGYSPGGIKLLQSIQDMAMAKKRYTERAQRKQKEVCKQ